MSIMYTALVMASVARWSGRATISSGCEETARIRYTGPITSRYFPSFGPHDNDYHTHQTRLRSETANWPRGV